MLIWSSCRLLSAKQNTTSDEINLPVKRTCTRRMELHTLFEIETGVCLFWLLIVTYSCNSLSQVSHKRKGIICIESMRNYFPLSYPGGIFVIPIERDLIRLENKILECDGNVSKYSSNIIGGISKLHTEVDNKEQLPRITFITFS